ncbi:hypothetical protein PLESTM_000361500 [Pleodorina starrii]|nr:hypothetical protein PLESTM_000361500 [Pleodorina starrii]
MSVRVCVWKSAYNRCGILVRRYVHVWRRSHGGMAGQRTDDAKEPPPPPPPPQFVDTPGACSAVLCIALQCAKARISLGASRVLIVCVCTAGTATGAVQATSVLLIRSVWKSLCMHACVPDCVPACMRVCVCLPVRDRMAGAMCGGGGRREEGRKGGGGRPLGAAQRATVPAPARGGERRCKQFWGEAR